MQIGQGATYQESHRERERERERNWQGGVVRSHVATIKMDKEEPLFLLFNLPHIATFYYYTYCI